MKAVIIHNPLAGRLDVARQLPGVREALQDMGWTVELQYASPPGKIDSLVRDAADSGAQAVFISGGDGSVGTAACSLAGTDVVLGVLPTGTANVWATELGLPTRVNALGSELTRSALAQAHGEIRRMDLGRCGRRLFMLWAGMGLDAYIVQAVEPRTHRHRRIGLLNYMLKGLMAARHCKGSPLRILGENETISGNMIVVIVSNIRLYAGGLINLDPQARVDDGQLSLWCFEGKTSWNALGHFARMLGGRHISHPQVHRLSGRRFVVESLEKLPAQMDGEVAGQRRHLEIEVMPETLNVFLPKIDVPPVFGQLGAETGGLES